MREMKRKKGSIIVEAAVTLPVFIIMTVTFCWMVKACALETAVFNAVENEVRQVSVIGTAPSVSSVRKALEDVHVDGSSFKGDAVVPGYTAGGIGGFVRVSFTYDTKISMPLPFVSDILLKNSIVYRNWNGYSNSGTPMGFQAMEESVAGEPVYIFPLAGEKYHKSGCRVMTASSERVSLSAELRKQYSSCPLCVTGRETAGAAVYIFKYGTCYHNGGCSAVNKCFIMMDRNDALAKGYTACSICGG